MEDKETYIRLSKSLDSLRDVALAEIELIESEGEKTGFANFVINNVKELLEEIARSREQEWLQLNVPQAEKFKKHAQVLLSLNAPSACPPGFVEVDGICVRL